MQRAEKQNAANDEPRVRDGRPEDADWILIEQIKRGNEQAFNALMDRYKRPILSFVFRMLGDASDAEDVAQEVFVRAYRSACKPGFRRTTGAFSTWLFQVARHAALDVLRRRKRRPTDSLDVLEAAGKTTMDGRPTAVEDTTARELGDQISAAVSLLPEDQRTAVLLAEYENFSYAAIAAVMRCSTKSVEARLYRARRSLRRQLQHLLDPERSDPAPSQ